MAEIYSESDADHRMAMQVTGTGCPPLRNGLHHRRSYVKRAKDKKFQQSTTYVPPDCYAGKIASGFARKHRQLFNKVYRVPINEYLRRKVQSSSGLTNCRFWVLLRFLK